MPSRLLRLLWSLCVGVCMIASLAQATPAASTKGKARRADKAISVETPSVALFHYQASCLAKALDDLQRRHGATYAGAEDYRKRLQSLQQQVPADRAAFPGDVASDNPPPVAPELWTQLQALKREALLAHPALRNLEQVLLVKRKAWLPDKEAEASKQWLARGPGIEIGFPSNHECNSSLPRTGWDNALVSWNPREPDRPLRTVYRPATGGGYVGEMDLHFDGTRLLYTESDESHWKIFEMNIDGSRRRQVTRLPDDVDCYDACYLPDGRIVFGSSAPFQAVPCWHGLKVVTNLYAMDADGGGLRRLCHDQDHDLHPSVLSNGQVIYSRWDYTGINHIFVRQLMVMNPDGTGQRAVYGSNSYFPNALYFPRAVPGRSGEVVAVVSGYHGPHRMGMLVVLDTSRGWYEAEGIVQRISGRGQTIRPEVRDDLIGQEWPKFLHPYPLDDTTFLVAAWPDRRSGWGLYLADRHDNLVLLREEPDAALLEPVPVRKSVRPPSIPSRVQPGAKEALIYLHDVYAGPGLAGVPRGTIKSLRVVGYHFGYPGWAGPHVVGKGGPWEVMRILGTVPIEEDGSALFRVPAGVPLSLQALDREGKAVQLMRSWYTAMPGEKASCIGCHESPAEAPSGMTKRAQTRVPSDIAPWYGPARGFDFEREVQPVLDRHCVGCHSAAGGAQPDLRPLAAFPDYRGAVPDRLGVTRMHPKLKASLQGRHRYTPAYEALIRYVRRVGVEDDARLLTPGEYHADTSELIQILQRGHQGVVLDAEAWDRLVTWIDLNAPCHGTWGDAHPLPNDAAQRRLELSRLAGGPIEDFEAVPDLPRQPKLGMKVPVARPQVAPVKVDGYPLSKEEASQRQARLGATEMTLDLGEGVRLLLKRVPAGQFVMGQNAENASVQPASVVTLTRPFWLAATETTNEQYRRFETRFDCGYYQKRHARDDDMGLLLNEARQPAVRVSWEQAMAFCRWLSTRTGLEVTLPTEAQWEWAARAGTIEELPWGDAGSDFSSWANLADIAFSRGHRPDGLQISGGLDHLVIEGADLADQRWNDGQRVTAAVGSYRPNVWGLFDMIGNAAEWTRSAAMPIFPHDDSERDTIQRRSFATEVRRVVRGGSFFDRPTRAGVSQRLSYPAWQRVFNVGFRVAVEDSSGQPSVTLLGSSISADTR